ncbi:protein transport protein HofB [Escherichia coli]|uniref:Protein transport protein HofB n=1 Tax=Escherichia coli TaxID=562 RepID=A0A484YLB1_ECOLX|nr:protein transport protein HofB [Escherichia coli]
MNIPQLTALCLRYQGVLLDASEEVVHVAVVDAPSHELLDALHFATTKRIEITCWTRQQMEGHASRTQQTLPVAVQEKHQPKAELLTRTLQSALEQRASDIHIEQRTMPTASACVSTAYCILYRTFHRMPESH